MRKQKSTVQWQSSLLVSRRAPSWHWDIFTVPDSYRGNEEDALNQARSLSRVFGSIQKHFYCLSRKWMLSAPWACVLQGTGAWRITWPQIPDVNSETLAPEWLAVLEWKREVCRSLLVWLVIPHVYICWVTWFRVVIFPLSIKHQWDKKMKST